MAFNLQRLQDPAPCRWDESPVAAQKRMHRPTIALRSVAYGVALCFLTSGCRTNSGVLNRWESSGSVTPTARPMPGAIPHAELVEVLVGPFDSRARMTAAKWIAESGDPKYGDLLCYCLAHEGARVDRIVQNHGVAESEKDSGVYDALYHAALRLAGKRVLLALLEGMKRGDRELLSRTPAWFASMTGSTLDPGHPVQQALESWLRENYGYLVWTPRGGRQILVNEAGKAVGTEWNESTGDFKILRIDVNAKATQRPVDEYTGQPIRGFALILPGSNDIARFGLD